MFKTLKPKSEFSRNVLTLMTGTTIAQAIPIAISPILTRLYTPEDFGVFALYMSIASIVAVMATGRYELAIMLPKKDEDAIHIVTISLVLSLCISFIALLFVFFFNLHLVNLLGSQEIGSWLYFIPLTVLMMGIYQSLYYWYNRKKVYKKLSKNKVIQSLTTSTTHLGMGISNSGTSGLIIGGLFGQGIVTLLLVKHFYFHYKHLLQKIKSLKVFVLLKKYHTFPKFDLGAALLSISSYQLIPILFNILFSSTVAGYYYLTQRVLGMPIIFLASSISDVFREEATREYHRDKSAAVVYKSTLKKLVFLGLVPTIILYFFIIDIFVIVFSEEWRVAGEYVQILVPMLFVKFVVSPLSFMLYIGGKQKLNLYSQVFFLLSVLYSFLMGETAEEVLFYISILFSLIYLYYLYISAKIAKVF